MARLVKQLTATQVNNAKPKAAMYKMFENDGKEGLLTFGPYPAVSLEQARKMRDEAKSQKAVGVDPSVARREEKAERMTVAKNTFEAVTRE